MTSDIAISDAYGRYEDCPYTDRGTQPCCYAIDKQREKLELLKISHDVPYKTIGCMCSQSLLRLKPYASI